ncbi:MAG: tRNA (adenosine(37)-N6)-threonylcarbamoyltransferase complex ATPase subunit type 1 TsaE [Verrucomicrobiota bacterium]
MRGVHQIRSEDGMIKFGEKWGQSLEAGEVIALSGDLGAGKTHLCKGIARGVGASEVVNSPTFSLVNEYRSGRVPIFHFDFYRLDLPEELVQIGWDDYLDEAGILLVEWAEKFPELLPANARFCRIEIENETERTVTVE